MTDAAPKRKRQRLLRVTLLVHSAVPAKLLTRETLAIQYVDVAGETEVLTVQAVTIENPRPA